MKTKTTLLVLVIWLGCSPMTLVAQDENAYQAALSMYRVNAFHESINLIKMELENAETPISERNNLQVLLANCYAQISDFDGAKLNYMKSLEQSNDPGLEAVVNLNLGNLDRLDLKMQNPGLLVERFYGSRDDIMDSTSLDYISKGLRSLETANESNMLANRNLSNLLLSYDLPLKSRDLANDALLTLVHQGIPDDWGFLANLNIANFQADDKWRDIKLDSPLDFYTAPADAYYQEALRLAKKEFGDKSNETASVHLNTASFHHFAHIVFWRKANSALYRSKIAQELKDNLMLKADQESLHALTSYQLAITSSLRDFNDTIFHQIPIEYSLSARTIRNNLVSFNEFRIANLLKVSLYNQLTSHNYKDEWQWDFNVRHFRIRSTSLMYIEDGFDYTLSGYAYNSFSYYDKFLEVFSQSLTLPEDQLSLVLTTYKDRVMAIDAALNYQNNISGFKKGVSKTGTKNRSVIKVKSSVKRSPVLDAYAFAEKTKALLLLKEINSPQADIGNRASELIQTMAHVNELQSKLDPATAVISYVLSPYNFYIFIVTQNELEVRYRGKLNATEINRQITALRTGMLFKIDELYAQKAWELGKVLLPKLEKQITKLVIIPDGFLNTLPFEVLFDKEVKTDEIGNVSDYPFWLKKYDISYAFSATLLLNNLRESSRVEAPSFLGYAPVFEDENPGSLVSESNRSVISAFDQIDSLQTRAILNGGYITPIPDTELEVQYLRDLFTTKGLKSKIITHQRATEDSFKQEYSSDFSILHLATHGFVNSEQPELSGVLFMRDSLSEEDGILYSNEIFQLNLNKDLVTLSACETGLGQVVAGEGVLGLSRSLTISNTRHLLVSYWKVSDASTSELMKLFYTEVLERKNDYSAALRKAKLALISSGEYAQPYYWSPFVLIKS